MSTKSTMTMVGSKRPKISRNPHTSELCSMSGVTFSATRISGRCATLTPCYLHFHQRKQNGMENVKIPTILLGDSIPSSISGSWGPVWLPWPPQSLPPSCQVAKTPKKQQLKTCFLYFFHLKLCVVFQVSHLLVETVTSVATAETLNTQTSFISVSNSFS